MHDRPRSGQVAEPSTWLVHDWLLLCSPYFLLRGPSFFAQRVSFGVWLVFAHLLVTTAVGLGAQMEQDVTLIEAVKRQDAEAVRLAKRAVVRGMDLPLAQALELEERLTAQLLGRRRRKAVRSM